MKSFRLRRIQLGLTALAIFVSTINYLHGEVTRIVSPASLADTEGRSQLRPDIGQLRLEHLVLAADFANLPVPHGPIVAFSFRADASQTESIDWTSGDETITVSTTDKSSLTKYLDDNHGSTKNIVHDGPIPFKLLGTGPLAGPRDIADGPRLDTPFYYDPSQGNLVIERLIYSNNPTERASVDLLVTNHAQSAWTRNLEGSIGTLEYNTPVFQFEFAEAGDFDGSGILDAHDMDQLSEAVPSNTANAMYDLNLDSKVDGADRIVWVEQLKRTYFGDADLDGEFKSNDFIVVLAAGEYEDGVSQNSHWASGDWDGNREFDSADIVMALQSGGYEIGPRQAIAVVPEPGSVALVACGLLPTFSVLRRRRSRIRGPKSIGKAKDECLSPSWVPLLSMFSSARREVPSSNTDTQNFPVSL